MEEHIVEKDDRTFGLCVWGWVGGGGRLLRGVTGVCGGV